MKSTVYELRRTCQAASSRLSAGIGRATSSMSSDVSRQMWFILSVRSSLMATRRVSVEISSSAVRMAEVVVGGRPARARQPRPGRPSATGRG